ncbi:GlxA family transcriptional regulator [Anaeromyxobacter oryzisoli]|uniref:GlxA family transcriptional regulator n=1 Tax=Anaeromyxobacter oryzisoli TaxID=2925408 RepID=UPI001F5787B8|nr:GlxA family transcriptional regulator [Anaeromyxobacter sp. SG63]
MRRRVVIVAFDACETLDVVGPLDVFATAGEMLEQRGARDPGYEPIVAGATSGALRTESGLCILPEVALARASARAPIDTLILAGGVGARRAAQDRAILRTVVRATSRARRVAAVCTGAFVLAAAGLLDGRRATTHWAFCDELAATHPGVRVERDPIYVRDGRFWTSAGVTAGIDLALALVEEDLGREVALAVARWLVVFVRRAGGQSQFSAQLASQLAARAPIRDLQAWIVEHPDAALDVPALARRAGMSVRHFSRVFRAEVGVSPAAFVERVRVETARRLLEMTTDGVEQVADAAGFGTAEVLRRAFARRIGLSPREYRARFGSGRS